MTEVVMSFPVEGCTPDTDVSAMVEQRVPLTLFGIESGHGKIVDVLAKEGWLEVRLDLGDASPDLIEMLRTRDLRGISLGD